jgi:hypothetical protein
MAIRPAQERHRVHSKQHRGWKLKGTSPSAAFQIRVLDDALKLLFHRWLSDGNPIEQS